MTPFWTCRRAPAPYLIAVTFATDAREARNRMAPTACVMPCELVTPEVLALLPADRAPGEVFQLEVAALPSWRDAHGDRLSSRQYCEDIGYDPT